MSSYDWDLWWVAHQISHLGSPWFTGRMAAPAGMQLGFDTTMPLVGVIMTPVTLAFGPAAALAVLTALAPGLACYAMYRAAYQASTDGVAGRDLSGYLAYTARLPGLFGPSPRVADFGLPQLAASFQVTKPGEGVPAFGVVLSVLAAAGLAAAWRRRSSWLLAVAWLGGAWLALGPRLQIGSHSYVPLSQRWCGVAVSPLMPYTRMIRVPGLSGFREADRLALLGLLAAALLAGSAVDWLRRRALWPARRPRALRCGDLAPGAPAGHGGRPPAGYRLRLVGAGGDHGRDQGAPLL